MAASFLLSRPRAAFTCARASCDGSIISQDEHVERIKNTFLYLFSHCELKALNILEEQTRNKLSDHIPASHMLVIAAYYENNEVRVDTQVFPFQKTRTSLKLVIIGSGEPRVFPFAKETGWITERKYLEQLKKENNDADELILSETDSSGRMLLFEGLITNFFVIMKEKGKFIIQTAPTERVLPGTMRKLIIEFSKALGFEVRFECPNWNNRKQWLASFVTSVTKPCFFIKEMRNINSNENIIFDLNKDAFEVSTLLEKELDGFLE